MEATAHGMHRCALCGAGADVHCAADAAFLCAACDAEVHGANFLASRHRRTRVLAAPKGRDDDDDDVSGTTSSISCVSTADSATTAARAQGPTTTRPRRTHGGRGDAVLRGWAKRMGIVAPGAPRRCASGAARTLQVQAVDTQLPRVPLRVAMAAALWREVAAHGVHEAYGDTLRRLEACSRVPARLVVEVASAMGRARLKRRASVDTEEGWGECS